MIQRRTFLAAAAAVAVSPLAFLRKTKNVWLGPVTLGKEKTIPFPSRGVFASHEEIEELSAVIKRQHDEAMERLAKQWENYLWGPTQ